MVAFIIGLKFNTFEFFLGKNVKILVSFLFANTMIAKIYDSWKLDNYLFEVIGSVRRNTIVIDLLSYIFV